MKMVVMTGSPRPKGTTNRLADEFIKGATEAGHEVFRFNCATAKVHPCVGCNHCGFGAGPCVFQDDFAKVLAPKLQGADAVVLCGSTYYFALNPQLASAISRFYCINNAITGERKAVLITACGDEGEWITDGIEKTHEGILKFMRWTDAGRVIARGFQSAAEVASSPFVKAEFGTSVEVERFGEKIPHTRASYHVTFLVKVDASKRVAELAA